MTDIEKTQLALRLPKVLLDQVDERAAQRGISRNEWFINMTNWVLDNTYTIEKRGGTP